ncbi:MAG: M18 family aminopeptidase [bacterium]|nr:M18 family aminopeptidase [bacterium]
MAELINELLDFIWESPVSCFAVKNIADMLAEAGFTRLDESEQWKIEEGRGYFTERSESSIIAFRIPKGEYKSVMLAAAHSDSPSFRIKPQAEHTAENAYIKLDVEGYGGMIMSSWFDRPLSAAGRVMRKTKNGIKSELVNLDYDSMIIPGLAIHMERETNKGHSYNIQKELIPLYGVLDKEKTEQGVFDKALGDNIGYDMYLYNRMRGTVWGVNGELFSAPRIDNLEGAFAVTKAFTESGSDKSLAVMAVFDNEEVGSSSWQGAKSDFLEEVLKRVNDALGYSPELLMRAKASGLMLSVDNAHAVHPNYLDKASPSNRPVINGGIVIKHNANRRYTTDAVSEALFRTICGRADVPYTFFTNRSDMPGGSTLGNLSNEQVSLNTVDIGLAQLAMHSAYETAGTKDLSYMVKALKEFYASHIEVKGDEIKICKE